MDRQEAEKLRVDDQYRILGSIYRCPRDPRLVVRNRWVFGWTWNFGHPRVYLALALIIGLFVFSFYVTAVVYGSGILTLTTFGILLLILIFPAIRDASGPKK